jgi:HSP20 family protein
MAYYFKKNYRPNSSSKKTSYNNLLNDLFLHFTDKDTDFFNELDDYPIQANVLSKENEVLIELMTPGIPKEDILIDCENNKLVVSYKTPKETSVEGEYIQQQIFKDGFKNTFKLTAELDQDKISAKMNNGILQITIPRKKGKSKNNIKIT